MGAAVGAGAYGMLKFPRGAHAAGWGTWPGDKSDALLPEARQCESVLELNINGGMSTFDTFYTIPGWGTGDFTFSHVYSDASPGPPAPQHNRDLRFAACAPAGVQSQGLNYSFQADDTAGNEVFLGPWIYPLRERQDVLDRMRIVVMRHDQAAHEGANPIAFTGDRLGQPRMAGVGTAIQRYFAESPELGGVRAAPYSYILYPAGYSPFNVNAATAVGFHPGSARPLTIEVDPASQLYQLLQRPGINNHQEFDAAIAYYRRKYERELQAFGHATAARSAERANYEFADFARQHAPELTDIITPDLFSDINPPAGYCGEIFTGNDMPRMQARMATSLLTRTTDAARYVLWIDAGLTPSSTGGHDTHSQSVALNSINITQTMQALLEQINEPAENDPNKIDLDRTMVVITTEFGRTPFRQGATGTNHWPNGYVSVFIGGPVSQASGNGNTVYGHMQEADGVAQTYVRPAENRMMILQALGIYPFSSQSYAVGDVPHATVDNELDAATRVRDVYLGYTA